MTTKLLVICITLLTSNISLAKKETTKDIMQDAFYSLTQLLPLMINKMSFTDKSNEKTINSHLSRMVTTFKSGNHQKILNSPGLKPNYESIVVNLESAQTSFNSGDKDFARLRLADSTSLCVSCHTQFPNDKVFSPLVHSNSVAKRLGDDHYHLGNLYLILRDYDKALNEYRNYIEKFLLKNKSEDFKNTHYNKFLYNSFFKLVYITGKSLNSPSKTILILEEIEKKHKLPTYISSELGIWKTRAIFWKKNFPAIENQDSSEVKLHSMIKFLEKTIKLEDNTIMSGDYDYDLMLISGIFSKQLLTEQNVKRGRILYWLGLAEYRLGKSIFFNIGDSYLKQCIKENTKQKIAAHCFKALETETNFKYTGTSGANLPQTVIKELKALKSLL